MDCLERMNDVLCNLFRDINALEEKAIATSDFDDLTINDIHVIDAIGGEVAPGIASERSSIYVDCMSCIGSIVSIGSEYRGL